MDGKIIALVDGSIYSESVCEHAAWVSGRTGSPVEIIHVIGRRDAAEKSDYSGSIRLGARSALLKELAEVDSQRAKLVGARGRAILEDARAIVDRAAVEVITTRLRRGDIVETISEVEEDARVVVIGKRGEAADFAKGHLGSNLERLVRAAKRPVFVASRAFVPIRKVLVAYDGGSSSMKAIEHIAGSPLFNGLEVTVVTVGPDSEPSRRGLESAGAKLMAAGLETDTRLIPGRPEDVLGATVEQEKYGMLVMGAYGHSRIRTLVIGSTTTEMLRSCRVPVLLMR